MLLPTTLVSLPPGVMLLNRATIPRDSATSIEKTSQKGAPEREQPNRSVVIIESILSKKVIYRVNNMQKI